MLQFISRLLCMIGAHDWRNGIDTPCTEYEDEEFT